ncbi:L-Rha 1,3-L-rhamnosyltransferase [Lactobacillus sp. HMSC17G08]|nr:L-Rha 1,3-L-rhamnosyltransferase [Lactobacillus sp. HMSC17G08]
MVRCLDKQVCRVAVLMSTYNGEKYVESQVRSIAHQVVPSNVQVRVYIRDDGSTDRTLEIVKSLKRQFKDLITIINEPEGNVGVKASFFSLLVSHSINADYYFLSDQDDIWDENKIGISLSKFDKLSDKKPIGVYSDLWIADKDANSTGKKMSQVSHWKKGAIDFKFLSFDYRVVGCAFAINNAARELFKNNVTVNVIKSVNMHDSFLALLIAASGQLYLIDKPTVFYRQHEGNVIGAIKKKETLVQKVNKAVAVPGQLVHDNVCVGEIIKNEKITVNDGVMPIVSLYRKYYDAGAFHERLSSAIKVYKLMHHRRRWLHLILMIFIHTTEYTTQPWIGSK